MNRFRSLKLILIAALGVLALGSLANLALARDGSHRAEKRHHGHHRHHHGGPSGTIESFDAKTGKLTIALLDGESISGLVDRRTQIRCEDEHAPDLTQLRHGESEPGDDNGGHGEEEPGDDHGGRGEEPGDDHGADDEPGDGHGGQGGSGPSGHDDNGRGANCTTSDLIVGTVVIEAELEIEHGTASFDEVELAG